MANGYEDNCGTCKCFRRAKVGQAMGVCRGGPPTVMLLGMAPSQLQGMPPIPVTNTFWPEVPDHEWCLSHTRRLPLELSKIDLSALDAAEMSE